MCLGPTLNGVGCRHSSSRNSEIGEHVCRTCGAPAPSFRKLLDCRLSLDRARAEVAETRAQATLKEEATAAEFRKVNTAAAAPLLCCSVHFAA